MVYLSLIAAFNHQKASTERTDSPEKVGSGRFKEQLVVKDICEGEFEGALNDQS
jgi:hypothetical protein